MCLRRSLIVFLAILHFAIGHLQFETVPRTQYVPEGEPVLLECQISAQADSLFEYAWTRNGTRIVHRNMVSAATPMDLFLQEFRPGTDSGQYMCIVTDLTTGARLSTPAASLNVLKYVAADIKVMEQLRTSVTLFCDVKTTAGEPMHSNISWYRNHHEMRTDDRFRVNNVKLRVKIGHWRDAEPRPAEMIRCGAHSSRAGMIFSRPFDLDALVERIENIVEQRRMGGSGGVAEVKDRHRKRSNDSPRTMFLYTEDQATLNCRLAVTESDVIQWTKDGKVFRTSRDEGNMPHDITIRMDGRISVDMTNGNLNIHHSSMGDDGVYQCQTVDSETGGVIQKGAAYQLSVRYKLKFTPTPTSKKLEIGVPGKIHCKAQGTPWPQIKWHRVDGGQLDDTMEDSNGTLHFKNVSKANAGNYTCVAENEEGKLKATINIQVVMSPRFVVAPVGPILARENETVVIHCQAMGDPTPTIQWDKDLEYLTHNSSSDEENRVQVFENGTLVIREVRGEDEGKYGCTIGNSGGLDRKEVDFSIKDSLIEGESDFTITKALLVTMALATLYIVFVVLLMMWCRYKKRVLQDGDDAEAGLTEKGNELDPFVPTDSTSRDCAVSINGRKGQFNPEVFEIDRTCVTDIVAIGRGEFGEVSVGRMPVKDIRAVRSSVEREAAKLNATGTTPQANGTPSAAATGKEEMDGDLPNGKPTNGDLNGTAKSVDIEVDNKGNSDEKKQVLIKALTKIKDDAQKELFQKQMELFGSVPHRNITRLYGVAMDKQPWWLVLEYTDWGDLKQFLLATAASSGPGGDQKMPPLTVAQSLTLAQQISRGMSALTKAGYVHGDLATRNCVISSTFVAKVSMPALCKDKYSAEYGRLKEQHGLLPLRWMAPELISGKDAAGGEQPSIKTDVWSYGVCMWELFSQAVELPYAKWTNEEYVERVRRRGAEGGEAAAAKKEDEGAMTLILPETCPVGVRELFEQCWSMEAADRPSFAQITAAILAKLKEETE